MTGELVPANPGEFLFYQTDDGQTRIQARVEGETVWLTQKQMADLFQTTKQNVSLHIQNIYEEGELIPGATVKQYLTVQTEGARQVEREVDHYNLDVIISVGYRVKSLRGTQFRIWATQRLRELIVKGFTMDDHRLKQAGGGNYFDELLDRIRDIRSSERVFWRKVLDIYATSIDYDGHKAVLFASMIPRGTGKSTGGVSEDYLRKDQVFLLERYFYFLELEKQNGLLVMDAVEKTADRKFVRQLEAYFVKTATGRYRTQWIVPTPFFVSSDMTYPVQAADLCIYCINWAFRLSSQDMTEPVREEIQVEFFDWLRRLQFHGDGYRDGHVFESWGICYVPNPCGSGRA
jgi:hypothetical protein